MPTYPTPEPLRWWENLALFVLTQSPRIHRIVLTQRVLSTDTPEDDDPDEELDTHAPSDYASYFEHLYRRSPDQEPEGD